MHLTTTTSTDWSSPFDDDYILSPSDGGEEEEEECLNTTEDLLEGIIKTRANTSNEYTILLVGETGTGKTSFLSLLANVLEGRSPKEYVFYHDKHNEAGSGQKHSQTNFAKLYEFESKNGVTVRVLDTPGLADTRGLAQDEKHKDSIAMAITNHISVLNAVLILANGTSPRLSAATDYALSTLSSIFPRSLAANIGIVLTNVPDQLSSNFEQESLPESLRKTDNQFWLDNPVALWKKYIALCSQTKVNKRDRAQWKAAIQDGHLKALRGLVSFFDWLDSLVPQPTTDILRLYETTRKIDQEITHFMSHAGQLVSKETELKNIIDQLDVTKSSREKYQNYQRIVNEMIWIQTPAPEGNVMCLQPNCYCNCPIYQSTINISKTSAAPYCLTMALLGVAAATGVGFPFAASLIFASVYYPVQLFTNPKCPHCKHPYYNHYYGAMMWQQDDEMKVVVDPDNFQRYTEATTEHDRQELLGTSIQEAVDQLRRHIGNCLSQVEALTQEYARVSLSGCFAGQVGKTIVLLELYLESMQQKGDVVSARKVEASLARMREMLDVLERVADNNQVRHSDAPPDVSSSLSS